MSAASLVARRAAGMKRSAVRELLKLTLRPDMISFAGGLPAPELFPMALLEAVSVDLLRDRGRALMQYGETEGVRELREWVARSLSSPAWTLGAEHVLITSGAQQALDLIGRVFVDDGDTVLVDNPTYLAALSAWRPCGARFEALPWGNAGGLPGNPTSGWGSVPKLVYLVPNFGNPTGRTLSESQRERVIGAMSPLSESRTVWVEDDPYGELRYEGVALPSLFSRAAVVWGSGSPVLRVGTFSKVLVPGLRVGWVAGEAGMIEALVRAKQAADLHSSPFNQGLVLELLRRGGVEEQLPRLREAYRIRRDALLEALSDFLPEGTRWTRPEGGMFVWVTLPEAMDAGELLTRALARGVAFVPGVEFHLDHSGGNTLRLNFTQASPDRIRAGIERLGDAIEAGHR